MHIGDEDGAEVLAIAINRCKHASYLPDLTVCNFPLTREAGMTAKRAFRDSG